MNKNTEEYTPKFRPQTFVTSTTHKDKNKRERNIDQGALSFENSMGLVSLNSEDISNIIDQSQPLMPDSIDTDLQRQRSLANESLQRATSKIGLIPSKYFKPNFSVTEVSPSMGRASQSTISESDLLESLRNTSTPRTSVAELNASKGAPRTSMSDWSKMLSNPNISIDNFMAAFNKQRDGIFQSPNERDSAMFLSPEEAAEKLLSDEKSWRQRNEIPVVSETSFNKYPVGEMPSTMSLGAYFGQKSDDLSNIAINTSPPEKSRQPVALVDCSVITSLFADKEPNVSVGYNPDISNGVSQNDFRRQVAENDSHVHSKTFTSPQPDDMSQSIKCLSISAIDRIISASVETPGKVADYLMDQAKKAGDSKKRYSSSRPLNSQDFPLSHSDVIAKKGNSPNTTNSSGTLPISRNSSYTSNFSENGAIKNIVDNKENFNSLNVSTNSSMSRKSTTSNDQKSGIARSPSPTILKPRSARYSLSAPSNSTAQTRDLISNCIVNGRNSLYVPSSGTSRSLSPTSRSSSSLSSLPDGKLPIESTKNELVWSCVKVDKNSSHEFLLRNKSSKTLKIQCNIPGRDFRIRKDNRMDSETLSACKLVFHANESRPLIISFAPTKLGSAVDEITFSPLDTSLTQTKKQCVRLFGYGGHTNIEYHGPMKDNTGKFWLSLGRLKTDKSLWECSFTVSNTGNLAAFLYLKFSPKRASFFTSLKVTPTFLILHSNETKTVDITYVLNTKDCNLLQKTLTSGTAAKVGTLEVFSDAEATRGRLRRLCRKCEERKLHVDPLALVLREKIRGESVPPDVLAFRESPSALKDLLAALTHHEIALTIEQDPDQTLVPELSDESAVFQTICVENSMISNETVILPVKTESCRLEPSVVVLNPPSKTEDSIFLVSETATVQHFECDSVPAGLDIIPSTGTLSPGETVILKVTYPRNLDHKAFKVVVYVENDMFETDVKILLLSSSGKGHQGVRVRSNFLQSANDAL